MKYNERQSVLTLQASAGMAAQRTARGKCRMRLTSSYGM